MRRIYFLLFSFIFVYSVHGQNVNKDLSEVHSLVQSHQGNGDPENFTTNPFQQNAALTEKIEDLTRQLTEARDNGNIALMRDLEARINAALGTKSSGPTGGLDAIPISVIGENTEQLDNIGITRIASGAFWATATTTQSDNGRIWVAATKYSDTFSDTLRIYYSDNGGVSWNLFAGFQYATADLNFRTDDLDIEVLSDGTDWWVYVTGSYSYSAGTFGFVARYKDDASGFFYYNLPKNANTSQYWTRVVSDYPRYTGGAYVYIVATMDSNVTGGTRKVFSRAFVIQNPYAATPTVTDRNNGAVGSNYWWYTASAPDSSTLKTDVAFYDSAGSGGAKVVTCSIFENHGSIGDAIYMTYSSNFMATPPSITNSIDLTYQSSRPVISFGGAVDQMKGCISTIRRHLNGQDTDPRYIRTSNGGLNWVQGYIDSSVDTTYDADVICLRGIDGHFKFAWTRLDAPNTNPDFNYRTAYTPGTSFTFTPIVKMDGAGIVPDNAFGGRAGYKLNGSDSCFAVFEGPSGSAVYGANGCSGTTVSITNTEIPVKYSLSQNYPNPFNPGTSIAFEIPKDGLVKVVVYDILGKEVATLVNDKRAAGSYIIDFNAAGLSSGVYFYKLIANEFTDLKKMTLIK
jgi:glycosyltransferase involved in cell wall biosynthesis